jgi:hypothetical protein
MHGPLEWRIRETGANDLGALAADLTMESIR